METIEIARLSSKGQITLPVAIRNMLGLKEGSKVIFAKKDDDIVMVSSNRIAFEKIQNAMEGEAEKAGIKTEQDVIDLVKQVRQEIYEEKYAKYDRNV